MKTIELNEAQAGERAIRDGQLEDVVIVNGGKPVAIVVPFDAEDFEWYTLERAQNFIQSIAKARTQISAGEIVSHEELLRELDDVTE